MPTLKIKKVSKPKGSKVKFKKTFKVTPKTKAEEQRTATAKKGDVTYRKKKAAAKLTGEVKRNTGVSIGQAVGRRKLDTKTSTNTKLYKSSPAKMGTKGYKAVEGRTTKVSPTKLKKIQRDNAIEQSAIAKEQADKEKANPSGNFSAKATKAGDKYQATVKRNTEIYKNQNTETYKSPEKSNVDIKEKDLKAARKGSGGLRVKRKL